MSKVNEVFSQMKRLSEEFSQGNSITYLTPQDLLTMYKRFNGYLLKSEPLPGLASFLLTMLEGEFVKNRRKKVAQKYGIEFMVLTHISHINSVGRAVISNIGYRCSRITEHSGYPEC